MKLTDFLQPHGSKAHAASRAKANAGQSRPGAPRFEEELKPRLAEGDTPSHEPRKGEKKERRPHALEALVLAQSQSNARPAPLIDTKSQIVKAPEHAKAIATRAPLAVHAGHAAPKLRESHDEAPGTKHRAAEPARDDARSLPAAVAEAKAERAIPTPSGAAAEPPKVFDLTGPTAVQAAAPLAPMAPLMMDDASLRAVLLPTVARVSLDAGESGRLNLQLKVNDGVTEIRATGPAAPLLEARQGELRVELAKEGLALGHFDLTQSGTPQRQERHDPFDAEAPHARRGGAHSSSTDSTTSTVGDDGRLHVKV